MYISNRLERSDETCGEGCECWRKCKEKKEKGGHDRRASALEAPLSYDAGDGQGGVSWNKASYRKMAERRKRREPRRRERETGQTGDGRKQARKRASQVENKKAGITKRGSHSSNPRLRSRWLRVGEGGDECNKRESRGAEPSWIVGRRSRGGWTY